MKSFITTYSRKDKRGQFHEFLNSNMAFRSINGGKMKKGAVMGNHYHTKGKVCFFLINGEAEVVAKNVKSKTKLTKLKLKTNEGVIIGPYEAHAWRFLKPSTFLVLKSLKYNNKKSDLNEHKVMEGK